MNVHINHNLNPLHMANLISLTSYSKLANQEVSGTATTPIVINVSRIISVTTRVTPYNTNGVSDVLIELPVNNSHYQVTLVVTEARAAILAAANAPLA